MPSLSMHAKDYSWGGKIRRNITYPVAPEPNKIVIFYLEDKGKNGGREFHF